MHMYYTDNLYTIKHKNTGEEYFLLVEQDEDAENPRNWDDTGTLVTWDKYLIGDPHKYTEPCDFLVAQAKDLLKKYPDRVFDYFVNKNEKELGLHIIKPTDTWRYYGKEIVRPAGRLYEIYRKGTLWGSQEKMQAYLGSVMNKEEFLCKESEEEHLPDMNYLLEDEANEADLVKLFYLTPDVEIRNIYIYEHSGVSISFDRTDRFDSRCAGWFVMSKQDIRKIYAFPEDVSDEVWRKAASAYMESVIEEYDILFSGEVYSVLVEPVTKFKDFINTCPKCIWDYRTLSRVIVEDAEWIGGLFGDKSVDQYLSDEGFDTDSATIFNFKKAYSF